MKNKQGNVAIIAIIIVIVAITAGVVGWMFAKKSQVPASQTVTTQPTVPVTQNQPEAQPTPQIVTTPQNQPIAQSSPTSNTKGWQNYKNIKFGFEFNYPKGWIIYERDDQKRVYIQNVAGEVNKGNAPADFRRIWIGYEFGDNQEHSEDALISDVKVVKSNLLNNNGINIRLYKYESESGEKTAEAYWERDGKKYVADCASEVGSINSEQEVILLEKIIPTFKFTN